MNAYIFAKDILFANIIKICIIHVVSVSTNGFGVLINISYILCLYNNIIIIIMSGVVYAIGGVL